MDYNLVLEEGGTVAYLEISNVHADVPTKEISVTVDLKNVEGDVLKRHVFSKFIEDFPIPSNEELQDFVLAELAKIYQT